MRRQILDGQQFGEWTVLKYAGDRKQLCRCSCGEIREVATNSLTSGRSKNCGSKSKHPQEGAKAFKDLTGQQFGELTAIEYVGDTNWKCTCEHGHTVIKSWKKLNNGSKCPECKHEIVLDRQKEKAKIAQEKRDLFNQAKQERQEAMLNLKVNDLSVVKKIGNDRWLCRCICGAEREVRGHSLRHPPFPEAYTCKHSKTVGERFGKLTVLRRTKDNICICKCDCGNIVETDARNLISGHKLSCGCMRVPTYSKEQVQAVLVKYIEENKSKPFIYELANLLGMGQTATRKYVMDYGLQSYINTKYGSMAERDIANLLSTKYNILLHDRKILSGTELDIYIPNLKVAIEFNGNYWHSSENKDKCYHQRKTIECMKQGIRLIHIFEYEWENPKYRSKIDNIIKNLLGENETLYARQLEISEVSLKEATAFEEEFHLQGKATSSVNIALMKDGEILGLMTFGKPRFNNNYDYELIRLCYRNGIKITGGAERMFKYFLNKYNPKSIITYCNLAKFSGEVYKKLGFRAIEKNPISEPNYIWTDVHSTDIRTRYQTMKKNLVEQELGSEDMTEDEIMIALGFIKVYDSGNLRLEYTA